MCLLNNYCTSLIITLTTSDLQEGLGHQLTVLLSARTPRLLRQTVARSESARLLLSTATRDKPTVARRAARHREKGGGELDGAARQVAANHVNDGVNVELSTMKQIFYRFEIRELHYLDQSQAFVVGQPPRETHLARIQVTRVYLYQLVRGRLMYGSHRQEQILFESKAGEL